ncbi:MAG: hypothetical protein J6I50_11535 [Clostridia bacterium]|nr:hypothetical protein [Clostridia bacterium]
MKKAANLIFPLCACLLIACNQSDIQKQEESQSVVPLVDSTNTVKFIDKTGYEMIAFPGNIEDTISRFFEDVSINGEYFSFSYGEIFYQCNLSNGEINKIRINDNKLWLKYDLSTQDFYPCSDDIFLCVGSGVKDSKTYIYLCTQSGDVTEKAAIPAEGRVHVYFFETENGIVTVVLDEASVFFYDESLNLLRTVYIGQQYDRVLRTKDGSYILGEYLDNAVIIKEGSNVYVPLSDRYRWDEKFNSGRFCFDENETLYISCGSKLYHLTGDGSSETLLLQWSDGMIINSPVNLYKVTENGDIIVSFDNVFTKRLELKQVRIKKEQSERIQLTVGSFYFDETLTYAVNSFNASQNTYEASLLVYQNYGDDRSWKRGAELLDDYGKDMLAGTAPDVMLFDSYLNPTIYYDKNAFVDLMPHFGDQLLGSVPSVFSYQGKLFGVPVGIRIDTLLCKESKLDEIYGTDGVFTLEDLYAFSDRLTDGQVLSTKCQTLDRVSAQSYATWIDKESGTVTYDAPSFSEYISFCKKWDESLYQRDVGGIFFFDGAYDVSNPALPEAIATDQLQLLDMPFHSLEGYMIAKMLFQDESFAFCGYPTPNGQSMYMQTEHLLTVNAASPVLGGAGEFINYMLSDAIQTIPYFYKKYLPSTRSGLRTLMDNYPAYGYRISTDERFSLAVRFDGLQYAYQIVKSYIEENPIIPSETKAIAIIMTEEEKVKFYTYLDTPMPTVPVDETVSGIIEEELSTWRAGAASLSDAAKRIQNRVFIYVNE